MVAQADAEACGNPVQEDGFKENAPTEHEKRRYRAYVKKTENNAGRPVNFA
jgi:hypothetical protein